MATYDESFKRQIAELVNNKIKTKAEIQREYNISPSTVVGWEKKFFGKTKSKEDLSPQELEIIKLKKIIREQNEEMEILKKATAIFSRDLK